MNNTRESTPPNPNFDLPNRSTELKKSLGSQDFVHQNLPNQEESKKSRQELL
jgi:hypothetical protein